MSVLRVRFVTSGWQGGPGLNTFYFRPLEAIALQSDATEAASRVRAFFSAISGNSGIFPGSWTGNLDPGVDLINEESGALIRGFDGIDSTPLVGASGQQTGPANVTLLLQMATSGVVAGRRVRGRANLGPLVPNASSGGSVVGAFRTLVATAADANLDVTISRAISHVVWSRPKTGTGARVGSLHDVLEYNVPASFGTLRSRRD